MPPSSPPREQQRIAKLLARAGIASRREIERMIAEGRIALDGKTVETPATLLSSLHGVTVDGRPVKAPAPARLFRFHKPAGLLTTERDPKGRPTIYDRLPGDLPRVMPVGRLDMNTEGLLLLTTDGELKRQLELPSTGVERTYRARAFGDVSQEQLEGLIEGIEIEGVRYGPIDANLERRTGRNQWIEMKLKEGKNREVRKVLEHLGLKVSRLIRTAYGPFELQDLPAGMVEEVRQHDLVTFRKALSDPTQHFPAIGSANKGSGDRGRARRSRSDSGPERRPPSANAAAKRPGLSADRRPQAGRAEKRNAEQGTKERTLRPQQPTRPAAGKGPTEGGAKAKGFKRSSEAGHHQAAGERRARSGPSRSRSNGPRERPKK